VCSRGWAPNPRSSPPPPPLRIHQIIAGIGLSTAAVPSGRIASERPLFCEYAFSKVSTMKVHMH